MTSQTRNHRHRSVKIAVVGAVTAGLLAGFGSSVALADPGSTSPATPTTAAASDSGVPQFKSADELLRSSTTSTTWAPAAASCRT